MPQCVIYGLTIAYTGVYCGISHAHVHTHTRTHTHTCTHTNVPECMYPVSHVLWCLCQEVESDLLLSDGVEGNQAKATVQVVAPWYTTEDNLSDLCHLGKVWGEECKCA